MQSTAQLLWKCLLVFPEFNKTFFILALFNICNDSKREKREKERKKEMEKD